ncbi:MAG TPA: sensor histidine kinase [Terracidiphilus sp.]|nr:sensor histidine kinase [Terracidiphilus sp.]
MTTENLTEEKFKFAVDSALLGELGEKLVSTVHVAMTELIKNSYDADAQKVEVSISPEEGSAPRVRVHDDGVGMTLDEVRKFWMKIGTSNKSLDRVTSKYGRLKTGSKGIGRFACRRLGFNLKLTTCAEIHLPKTKHPRYQTTEIAFDWADFKPGIDVESVLCDGQTTISPSGIPGTTLEIWGGPIDEWQTRGFNYLQRQLAVLASNRGTVRSGFGEDPGFNVVLSAPGLTDKSIDLRDAVVDATWGTLTAEVGADGRAVFKLNAKGLGGTKKFVSSEKFPRVIGAHLRIGILPTRKEEARKPELLANYVLTDLVDEWGGIHVRYNGFRMYPYGDSRDDWLRIDADRGRRLGKPEGELFNFASSLDRVNATRALLNMLSMRSYLGQVELTSQIVGLIPRIDRQGFIENEVFSEVRRFARFAVDWANIYRDQFIRLRENEDAEQARQAVRPILNLDGPKEDVVPKAATFLRHEIKRLVQRLPETQRKETEVNLVRTVRAMETASSESYRQLEHLRLVASASTLTFLFAHEVRTVIGSLGASSARLNQLARVIPGHSEELKLLGSQLQETKGRLDDLVGMTGIVGAFQNKDKLADIHLKTAIDRATYCFKLIIDNYEITVDDLDVPTDLTVGPIVEGELYTILLNLLSNAVKSVIAGGGDMRTIKFDARRSGNRTVLRILDTGVGLAPDFFDEVFTPFISDPAGDLYDKLEARSNPEDGSIFGTGSGLGLAIARDVARSRGGDIHFIAPDAPWSACVEVELP